MKKMMIIIGEILLVLLLVVALVLVVRRLMPDAPSGGEETSGTDTDTTETGTDTIEAGATDTRHTHQVLTDARVEPTCTETGLSEGTHCGTCGEVLTARDPLPPTGHVTYTEDGFCSACRAPKPTEGLAYTLNAEGTAYTVSGMGTATEGDLVIADRQKGLPVTEIDAYAFRDCRRLTSVVIPNGVTRIGDLAFAGCTSLAAITIPDSVTSIGIGAFTSTSLPEWEEGIAYVERWVVDCEPSLTTARIRADSVGIGSAAFYECTELTSITIPDGVMGIGSMAFSRCYGLTSIAIPGQVRRMEFGVFAGCHHLETILFDGTQAAWNALPKDPLWDSEMPTISVRCTDGILRITPSDTASESAS